MTTTKKIQLRGHCQCCGRIQAVVDGRMSKHGYEVKERGKGGWFSGVCGGHVYAPLEVERTVTDSLIVSIRKQVVDLRAHAAALESGKAFPGTARSGRRVRDEKRGGFMDEMVPYAQAPEYHQITALESAVWETKRRAELGERTANDLQKLADRVHGQPLQEVKRAEAPAPLVKGEQRKDQSGNVLTFKQTEGARAYYTWERDGKTRTSWMATRSWRALEAA
jgi:hypothetical protein